MTFITGNDNVGNSTWLTIMARALYIMKLLYKCVASIATDVILLKDRYFP